jgi:hypothetical protein
MPGSSVAPRPRRGRSLAASRCRHAPTIGSRRVDQYPSWTRGSEVGLANAGAGVPQPPPQTMTGMSLRWCCWDVRAGGGPQTRSAPPAAAVPGPYAVGRSVPHQQLRWRRGRACK